MQVGQRFTFAYALPVLFILIAILIGTTPENAEAVVMEMIAPLAIFVTGIGGFARTINKRVASGDLVPGDLAAILQRREFWVFVAMGGAWLFQRLGLGVIPDGFNYDLLVNAFMAVSSVALYSFGSRSSGAPS